MISLREYVYRGHNEFDGVTGSEFKGKSPFVWLSYEKGLALEYASKNTNSVISKFKLNNIKSFDAGNANQVIDIRKFLSMIKEQSLLGCSFSSKLVEEKLEQTFGYTKYSLDKFWFGNEDLSTFLTLHGFNSIKTIEDNTLTIGIIQDKFNFVTKLVK